MESIWSGDDDGDDDGDDPPGAVHVATMSAGASGTTNLFIVGLNINLKNKFFGIKLPDIEILN